MVIYEEQNYYNTAANQRNWSKREGWWECVCVCVGQPSERNEAQTQAQTRRVFMHIMDNLGANALWQMK